MKNRVFVDTVGWNDFLDATQPQHAATKAAYLSIVRAKRRIVTTNYVIAELVALLTNRSRFTRDQIITAIETIKGSVYLDLIHIDEATDAAAWAMLKQFTDKACSLIDASSFVVMRNHGITEALTTDHHFAQAGFVRLPASER